MTMTSTKATSNETRLCTDNVMLMLLFIRSMSDFIVHI